MASAPGLPPGSRVSTISNPRSRKASARRFSWVDLPTPSPPSSVMNLPLTSDERGEASPDPSEEARLAHLFLGDERHGLRRRVGRRDDEVGDMLALRDRRLDRAVIDDPNLDILRGHARRQGDGKVLRRDEAHLAVAAELDLRVGDLLALAEERL